MKTAYDDLNSSLSCAAYYQDVYPDEGLAVLAKRVNDLGNDVDEIVRYIRGININSDGVVKDDSKVIQLADRVLSVEKTYETLKRKHMALETRLVAAKDENKRLNSELNDLKSANAGINKRLDQQADEYYDFNWRIEALED